MAGLVVLPQGCGLPGVLVPENHGLRCDGDQAGRARASEDSLGTAEDPDGCRIENLDDRCEMWTATYDGPDGGVDSAGDGGFLGRRTIVTSPDDSTVYVSGLLTGTRWRAVTIAYDAASGARRWLKIFEAPDGEEPRPVALTLSPDGRTLFVLVSGGCGGPGYLVAYDAATGSERWDISHAENIRCTIPTQIVSAASPTGARVYISGYLFDGGTTTAGWVLALDVAADGSLAGEAWRKHMTGREQEGGIFFGLAVSPAGDTVYQAGGLNEPGSSSKDTLAVVAYRAADGERLWDAYRDVESGGAVNGLMELAVVGDRLFASGLGRAGGPGAGRYIVHTMAFDRETGHELWSQVLDRTGLASVGEGTLAAAGEKVFVTSAVTGDETTGYGEGWTVAAYDQASGAEVWTVDSVDPVNRVLAYAGFNPAIAVSPSGDRVFVTGPRGQHHRSMATTIAYDGASGAQLWSARWMDRASWPTTLVVSRDGRRVFVTGAGTEVETYPARELVSSSDLLVLAYEAA